MKLGAYDTFLIKEVMPKMKKALQDEDNIFKENLKKTSHKTFYKNEIFGLFSNVFTERTLQYIVFSLINS